MPRILLLIVLLLPGYALAAAQGLSPSAGAVSEGLYTNLYFGMNYKLPPDWKVSFVARTGECERDCMLLDARAPGNEKWRSLTITAEELDASSGPERKTRAGASLEQLGAKKVAPGKEVAIAGRKGYRTDYRSTVIGGDVYYTIVMLPAKEYAVVFSFSSESRKQLDTLLDELPKGVTFVGRS